MGPRPPVLALEVRPVDQVVVATGFRPDRSVLAELRTGLDPATEAPVALAPLIDPNVHSCGTVRPHGFEELQHPEPDLYVIGMKSYGRAPTFLLLTGYEQARSVSAALAGDLAAAREVRLVLPETGVCGGSGREDGLAAAGGCCGTESTGEVVNVSLRRRVDPARVRPRAPEGDGCGRSPCAGPSAGAVTAAVP